ncbi:hypothetical protein E9993_09775 [Labilibacter sediminis]|nr:hypothetical protein E9993_09775 [Labilibacter sediminis]
MKRINKNRKVYSKPVLEVIEVDSEISLVMATSPPVDPGAAQEVLPPSESSPIESSPPSFENDPFGGSSPDY